MKWNSCSKIPKLFSQTKSITIPSNRHLSRTISVGIQRSKDVLMRRVHSKTHYRLGNKGWKNYPDSQAGKYKYMIGYYIDYNDKDITAGWETDNKDMGDEWEWIYLPKSVDAGYIW